MTNGKATTFIEGMKAGKDTSASKLQWWIMVSLWGLLVMIAVGVVAYVVGKADDLGKVQAKILERVSSLEAKADSTSQRVERIENKVDNLK